MQLIPGSFASSAMNRPAVKLSAADNVNPFSFSSSAAFEDNVSSSIPYINSPTIERISFFSWIDQLIGFID